MGKRQRLLALALAVTIILPLSAPGAGRAQEDDQVAQLMAEMTSAAKVGQLFLVTFPGSEVTDDALITELIRDYHVGGVVLLPENDNIVNEGATPEQVATLIGQLQQTAWVATQPTTDTLPSPDPFIPLFIAVSHEGNSMPFTSISNGTTPLPSQMALGATWNTTHAETTGRIVGTEMRAMGINMLLGPSLDVLENPVPESAGDLGVRSFGGEPFWVGKMGQAYIRGVHQGADGRVAVIAKHFPGLGASDRSLDEEISTVQRTLEKLRQIDLAPFFATAQSEDPTARPDGILVSHIRFRGLEGDRFATTRPISVDSQWLQRLLAQEELIAWRGGGGVTVSDGLGVRALRRFYDPSEASFNSRRSRRIAREAFLAGNDLLILSQFALSSDWEEQGTNIKSTITFFQERYEADPSFQTLVDDAVARILRLKLSTSKDTFALSSVQPNAKAGDQVGIYQEELAAIGRDAITLLSPPSADLIPSPPTSDDYIVIFTDSRSGQPCATCALIPYIDPLMLQTTMVRLYGPATTGQITPWRVSSFTFDQLEEYMSAPESKEGEETGEETVTPPEPHPIEPVLGNADWVIFAMLSPTDGSPQPSVVRRFLAEYADTLQNPNLIVLAYDAPYYLDATEVNKLSAYYVTYNRVDPFIETSLRAMFGEFVPGGKPPVNVTGINYDLITQTSPDPAQTIAVDYTINRPEEPAPEPTEEITVTPKPTEEELPPESQPEIGDVLRMQTSVIVDRNGHPVPDGTRVQFIFSYPQEALENSATVTTRDGVAETVNTLDRAGQLEISVQTDPVPRTIVLQIAVQPGDEIVPTWTPEVPSTTTPTPTTEPPPTPVPTPMPTLESENGDGSSAEGAGFGDLILALFGALIVSGAGYYILRFRNEPVERALRIALWSAISGLGLYVAYAIGLPGAGWLRQQSGVWTAGWVALFGGIVPLAIIWFIGRQRTSG